MRDEAPPDPRRRRRGRGGAAGGVEELVNGGAGVRRVADGPTALGGGGALLGLAPELREEVILGRPGLRLGGRVPSGASSSSVSGTGASTTGTSTTGASATVGPEGSGASDGSPPKTRNATTARSRMPAAPAAAIHI
ncbi:MAG: hypothetical protein ACYTKD_12330 [Planctomycetota bacterium]